MTDNEQEEEDLPQRRFQMIVADSLIDLVLMLNELADPWARVIYIGPNTHMPKIITVERNPAFIAILDIAPQSVITIGNNEDSSDFEITFDPIKTTLSA